MNNKKRTFFIISLVLFSFLIFFPALADSKLPTSPTLNADPETINFSDVSVKDGNLTVPWIAEYILGWYNYAIIIGGVIATLFLIFAGLRYLTSFGNPEGINKAKKQVMGSIIGLVVLLSAYLILSLINPQLTELKGINLMGITPEEITYVEGFGVIDNKTLASSGNIQTPSCEQQISKDYFKTTADISVPSEVKGAMYTKGEPAPKVKYYSNTELLSFYNSLNSTEKNLLCQYIYNPNNSCENVIGAATLAPVKSTNNFLLSASLTSEFAKLKYTTLIQLKNVIKDAQDTGIHLTATSLYRTANKQVIIWNSGLIARYQMFKEYFPDNKNTEKITANFNKAKAANGSMISKPNCLSPHVTGGAIDLKISTIINPETKEQYNDNPTFSGYSSATNMTTGIYNNEFKALLNHLMAKNGFIRYCKEWWHFEHSTVKETTTKKNFPGSTCGIGNGSTTWEKTKIEIPKTTLDKIETMIGEDGMKTLGLQ